MQREKKERCVVYIVARTDNGKRQLARERERRKRRKEKDRRRMRVTHHPQPSGLIQSTDDPLFVPVSFFLFSLRSRANNGVIPNDSLPLSLLARSVHAI